MKLHTIIAATIGAAAIAAPLVVAAPAHADTTAGDSIVYQFCSDTTENGVSTWYDGDNDLRSFDRTHLPSFRPSDGNYCGTQRDYSRSAYQLTGNSIQTYGYWASCEITVNGTLVASNAATGHYSIAECSA